jgi:hypothetical protein
MNILVNNREHLCNTGQELEEALCLQSLPFPKGNHYPFSLVVLVFELRALHLPCTCQVGALPLEPLLHFYFVFQIGPPAFAQASFGPRCS